MFLQRRKRNNDESIVLHQARTGPGSADPQVISDENSWPLAFNRLSELTAIGAQSDAPALTLLTKFTPKHVQKNRNRLAFGTGKLLRGCGEVNMWEVKVMSAPPPPPIILAHTYKSIIGHTIDLRVWSYPGAKWD
jgi:hypothetical protein